VSIHVYMDGIPWFIVFTIIRFIQSLLNSPVIIQHLLSFLSQKYSYTRHANETMKPAICSSSSSSLPSTMACSCAQNIFPELVSSLWLHQFSFTMPPPYFHEVKLVFTNDPRIDIYADSYISMFNGKCRSSRFDEAYTRCLIFYSIIEKGMIFLLPFEQLYSESCCTSKLSKKFYDKIHRWNF